MSDASQVKNVGEADFVTEVIDRSRSVPVVVDFWAEWCAPCRALGPVLERLYSEADGEWELAKVDVDANPDLARRYEVYGIPAVKGFRDGQVAAEFTGALPEEQVRQWLGRLGPSEAETLVLEGRDAEESSDLDLALRAYRSALDRDPSHSEARAGVARIEVALRLEASDEAELRARLERDPRDIDAQLALADIDFQGGGIEKAFTSLLEVIRTVDGDARERARKHLLQLMETLPANDPRVASARRDLASALY